MFAARPVLLLVGEGRLVGGLPRTSTRQNVPAATIVTPVEPRNPQGLNWPHITLEHQSTALMRTVQSLQ
jgi:hypothetical protein